jgi:integrase
MPRPRNPIPSYRLHRQSGQAVTTLRLPDGTRKDVLLGVYNSHASKVEYERVISEWRATSGRAATPPGLTVNELILAFWGHAERHYRHPDGTPTSELDNYKLSLRPLKALYGDAPAAEFSPLKLKAVRQRMVDDDLSLNVVNQRTARIKHLFKWAVAEELVAPAVYQALQAVSGIPRGRDLARETAPVRPVPDAFVDAVQPHVLPEVWAMVELQRLTGMRPGEVCRMRACDLDTRGQVWLYRPVRHKSSWRGKERVIALGPKAQAVVKSFLLLDTSAPLFSPRRAMAARAERLRTRRKTKVQPSQANRRKEQPRRAPGEVYTVSAYATAIDRACVKAGVPCWSPNRLRHSRATDVRRQYGVEAAGAVLGHAKMSATEVYAARDAALAQRIAAEIG